MPLGAFKPSRYIVHANGLQSAHDTEPLRYFASIFFLVLRAITEHLKGLWHSGPSKNNHGPCTRKLRFLTLNKPRAPSNWRLLMEVGVFCPEPLI